MRANFSMLSGLGNIASHPARKLASSCSGSVFAVTIRIGHPMSPDILTQKVRRYLDVAGIQAKGSCHLFRHASATALLEGGADIRFVQDFLGHSQMRATEIYTHVTLTKFKAVYEACHPGARLAAAVAASASSAAAEVLEQLENENEEDGQLHE